MTEPIPTIVQINGYRQHELDVERMNLLLRQVHRYERYLDNADMPEDQGLRERTAESLQGDSSVHQVPLTPKMTSAV